MTLAATLSPAETRRRIAALGRRRCGCPGWAIFDTARGLEIERCDECFYGTDVHEVVSDDDVAGLPEAQAALADAVAECEAEWFESIGRCAVEVTGHDHSTPVGP